MGAPLLLLAQALTSCGSDDDGGANACEPNTLKACPGPGGCEGEQTCRADGSGFTDCACEGSSGSAAGSGGGVAGSANAGVAGSAPVGAGGAGSIDSPVFPPEARAIGTPCETDSDCPTGPGGETPLTCITSTNTTAFGTGGPQGGYCTLSCRETDQCASVDPLSICTLQDAAGDGTCITLCQPGTGGVKCPGIAQACLPPPDDSTLEIGACIPVCTSDASCGAGQFCNLDPTGAALCSATPPAGTGDIGAPCTTATAATDCKSGLCLTLQAGATGGETISFCSSICTFGNFNEGCGYNPADATREAYCAQPTDLNGDIGDLGFCVELCDTSEDCGQPDWDCVDLLPAGQELFGRTGECVPPGTVVDAPDAGAP